MKTVLVTVAALAFFAGCSCKDSAKESSVKEEAKTQEPQHAEQTFSPDHAGVRAVIAETSADAANPRLTLRVERVIGYGSGAPAIAEGSEIDASISKALFEENREAIEAAQNADSALIFTLRSSRGGVGSSGSGWVIVEVRTAP
jgi:hypothetical protein